MKNSLIYGCVLLIVFVGCDNRVDFVKDLNNAPQLKISAKSNAWVTDTGYYSGPYYDTLKLGINDRYRIDIRISDDGKTEYLRLYVPTAQFMDNSYYIVGNQKVDNSTGSEVEIPGVSKTISLAYFTDVLTNHILNIKVGDSYGESDAVLINLSVFDNWLPITGLAYQVLGQLSPYEVKIDASSSYDPDEKFGGDILEYEYTVDGSYVVNTDMKAINYIFPTNGAHIVKLRVMDNDSAWSAFETMTIVL